MSLSFSHWQKGDPLAPLKKQLEEKEKQLTAEQGNVAAAKNRLRELTKVIRANIDKPLRFKLVSTRNQASSLQGHEWLLKIIVLVLEQCSVMDWPSIHGISLYMPEMLAYAPASLQSYKEQAVWRMDGAMILLKTSLNQIPACAPTLTIYYLKIRNMIGW